MIFLKIWKFTKKIIITDIQLILENLYSQLTSFKRHTTKLWISCFYGEITLDELNKNSFVGFLKTYQLTIKIFKYQLNTSYNNLFSKFSNF